MQPTFDFGEAIRQMKAGACVARQGWNGKGMHIYLEDALSLPIRGGAFAGSVRKQDPVICLYTAQGTHQPGWNASQADMLADDWTLVTQQAG